LRGATALAVRERRGGLGPAVIALFTDYLFHDARALPYALPLSAALMLSVAVALLVMLLRFNPAAGHLQRTPQ